MPRHLILGNGSVLATFDTHLQMRDLYYPHVGMEDHTAYGDVHHTGIWTEGKFAWFSDPSFQIDIRYMPDTLVGETRLRNSTLGLEIIAHDFVHPVKNVLVRYFRVRSTDGREKDVRFFFHHDLHIYGDKQKDTAFYEPYTNSVIHYRQRRYFLVGGETSDPTACRTGSGASPFQSLLHSSESIRRCGISDYSIGKSEYRGLEGTWRDAEDGELQATAIDQGSVDSTVGIYSRVHPDRETTVSQWMCFGKTFNEVIDLHQQVQEETPWHLLENCRDYWKSWVEKTPLEPGSLPKHLVDLYKRSLLTIRIHADHGGGILAAADADIMEFNRDTYTYVWPRDGAFVCMALDQARYIEVTRCFFEFCSNIQSDDGYFLHKFNPDGSIGSSWHPWFRNGEPQLPIQEDETALLLVAGHRHFLIHQDFEFLKEMYEKMLRRAANFLCDFREDATGLPLSSYDPWEEHKGIFTYTTACTIAGLTAAVEMSRILGHGNHAERYENAANAMRQAMLTHLYDEKLGCFLKKIKRRKGETIERDSTLDMSMAVIWKLGVLPPDDPKVLSTMQKLEEALRVRTKIGGYARYTGDVYHGKVQPSAEVPGNPWFITTLWMAQWHIVRATSLEELVKAREILEWTQKYASPAGILAEQLHPLTGEPLSVAPLVWSHATYVETVLLYLEKERQLTH